MGPISYSHLEAPEDVSEPPVHEERQLGVTLLLYAL